MRGSRSLNMNPRIEKFIGDTMVYFVSFCCECVYRIMAAWGHITGNREIVNI
jgi:hypothetical protein